MQTKTNFLFSTSLLILATSSISFAMDTSNLDPKNIFDIIKTTAKNNLQKTEAINSKKKLWPEEKSKVNNLYLNKISEILLAQENKDKNFDNIKLDGYTPIALAVQLKAHKIVDSILSLEKADCNQSIFGESLLEIACKNNDLKTVKILLKYETKINDQVIKLAEDIQKENPKILELLLITLKTRLEEKKEELSKLEEIKTKRIITMD